MHRNVEYVVGDTHGFLVEVVTNPGAVREKMLDGHLITDQRKISTEYVAGRRTQGKSAASIELTTTRAVRVLTPLAIPN